MMALLEWGIQDSVAAWQVLSGEENLCWNI